MDADGDGYFTTICTTSTSYSVDCDDTRASVHPLAGERCDGEDDNCDGVIDDPGDVDQDGFEVCDAAGDDCDDLRADVYPGAPDPSGDAVDNNCDGVGDADIVVCPEDLTPTGTPHFATIQEAVEQAAPGSVIGLCPARYIEAVYAGDKSLSLIGISARERTIIAPGISFRAFTLVQREDTHLLISNVTLEGGGHKRTTYDEGGAILVEGGSLHLEGVTAQNFVLLGTYSSNGGCPIGGSGCGSDMLWYGGRGGVIAANSEAVVAVSRSHFINNRAHFGG